MQRAEILCVEHHKPQMSWNFSVPQTMWVLTSLGSELALHKSYSSVIKICNITKLFSICYDYRSRIEQAEQAGLDTAFQGYLKRRREILALNDFCVRIHLKSKILQFHNTVFLVSTGTQFYFLFTSQSM